MDQLKSVCVYCGASNKTEGVYKRAAENLGKELAQNNLELIYGGGKNGLMGLVSTSALNHGGEVTGFIPEHLDDREGAHTAISNLFIVDNMHERKMGMFDKSDAFVILPGGFGTLDEFFEILTWKQISLHHKPIVVVNTNGYWNALKDLMESVINAQFAQEIHRSYVDFVETPEDVVPTLKRYFK